MPDCENGAWHPDPGELIVSAAFLPGCPQPALGAIVAYLLARPRALLARVGKGLRVVVGVGRAHHPGIAVPLAVG